MRRGVLGSLCAAVALWWTGPSPSLATPAERPRSSLGAPPWRPGPPTPGRLRLAGVTLRQGAEREELAELAAECNRLAGAEVCRPSTFAEELRVQPSRFVPSFAIDAEEVSLGAYLRCVRSGRCGPPQLPSWGEPDEDPRRLPVVGVTRAEAADYCAFASGRLPREDELERAARGGAGRRYPWGRWFHAGRVNGGSFGVAGTERRDGFERLAPTHAFLDGRTPEGILQLSGNVEEWTEGDEQPDSAPPGLAAVRGGHFASPPHALRATARRFVPATLRSPSLGFRCVNDVAQRARRRAAPPLASTAPP